MVLESELSDEQLRFWIESQRDPNSALLHVPLIYELKGELDIDWFKQCTLFLLNRETVFNTSFFLKNGIPMLRIEKHSEHGVDFIDFNKFDTMKTLEEERTYVKSEADRPLELLSKCNYKIVLYRSKQKDLYYFSCVLPHILIDGYSSTLLFKKLSRLYYSKALNLVDGSQGELESIPRKKTVVDRSSERYWEEKISDHRSDIDLGKLISEGESAQSFSCLYFDIEKKYFDQLKSVSKKLGTTPFLFMMSVYAMVLYRYTGQEVFSILHPIDLRGREEKKNLGCYVSLLPFYFKFKDHMTLLDLVRAVTKQRKSDKPHQNYSYTSIFRLMTRDQKAGPNVLFSKSSFLPRFELEGIEVRHIRLEKGHAGYNLSLLFDFNDDGVVLCLEHNRRQVATWLAEQLLHHLGHALQKAPECLSCPIQQFPLLAQKHLNKMMYPSKRSVEKNIFFNRLEKIVKRFPNNIALRDKNRAITYQNLSDRTLEIAASLQKRGIRPQNRVAILIGRDLDYILCIMALIQLRCTYIPIDFSGLHDRTRHILKDSNAQYLICNEVSVCQEFNLPVIFYNSLESECCKASFVRPVCQDPSDVMYIIYTSGTSGKPKGVPIQYASMDYLLAMMCEHFDFHSKDVWSLTHSFAFDFSVWEIWGALLNGAELVLVPQKTTRDPFKFYQFMTDHQVTVCNLTPSAFKNFASVDTKLQKTLALRYIIFGGEKLLYSELSDWIHRHGVEKPLLINMYGLTEAPVHATFQRVTASDKGKGNSLIGRALPGMQLIIEDQKGGVLPAGVYGEILLSSPYMTKGYLNQQDLNRQKFHPYCFNGEKIIVYRTGDHGCWLEDGSVNFLGRFDGQVQLNGYRIELDEINHVLQQITSVDGAYSMVFTNKQGHKNIFTFCVGQCCKAEKKSLLSYLRQKLPFYMVPSDLFFMDHIPLTSQGKVDRKKLEDFCLSSMGVAKSSSRVTKNYLNEITAYWKEILDISEVEIDANYFDLGGNSIDLLTLHHRLESLIDDHFPFNELFYHTTIRKQADYLHGLQSISVQKIEEPPLKQSQVNSGNEKTGDIAIIGLSLSVPEASTTNEFWENLKQNKTAITFFEEALEADQSYVPAKGYLDEADCFDAAFFSYPDREAAILDPQHRKLLESTWSALENSGYVCEEEAGKVGVFLGQSNISSYYHEHVSGSSVSKLSEQYQCLINNSPDFLSSRIAYQFNFTGPAMTIQTGCSTSLVSVCRAAQSLLLNECDMAVAGGISITLPLKGGYQYEPGMILSPDGHCRPFDAKANGTVPGNGVGVVVLKRYEKAIADGDHIEAVIKGVAVNNDGAQKIGFTAPGKKGQIEVIQQALRSARVSADTIDYIEAHGTGTPLGDPIELEALNEIMSNRSKPYTIGATKGNIGHLDAASGVVGLIKTVLCLKHKTFVPIPHFNQLNLKITDGCFHIPKCVEQWSRQDHPRRAGVSSFGIGGTNAHVILEEPKPTSATEQSKSYHLFLLSAHSDRVLRAYSANLARYLKHSNSVIDLGDLAYTLQRGRKHFPMRMFYVTDSHGELILNLESDQVQSRRVENPAPVCFLFPGQGLSALETIDQLYDDMPVFKTTIQYCVEQLKASVEIDLSALFSLEPSQPLNMDFSCINQLYIFISEYALAKQWMAWGLIPSAMVGHSLGEYVAACVSEIWCLEDALQIVYKRQMLMNRMKVGAMLSVSLSFEQLCHYLSNDLSVAAVNSPVHCTVSGGRERIRALQDTLKSKGIHCQLLPMEHAFHSADIEAIQPLFESCLAQFKMRPPTIPFLSNLSSEWVTSSPTSAYWSQQMRNTVLFSKNIEHLIADQSFVFLELGFSRYLSLFVSEQGGTAYAPHHSKQDLLKQRLAVLGALWQQGCSINWKLLTHKGGQRKPLPGSIFQKIDIGSIKKQ